MWKVRYHHYTMDDWAETEFNDETEYRSFINQLEFYGAEYNIVSEPTPAPAIRLIYA